VSPEEKFYTAATKIGTMVSWLTDKEEHSALAVFQDPEHNLRTSAEFRLFEVLEKRQALYSGLDCAELKKEDCKSEATKSKCAWDFEEETCTTRCPASYVAAAEEQIPKENLGSFCTPEVDVCANKCSGMDFCTAFSFKKMSTIRRCVTSIAITVQLDWNGNCILLGGGSYGSQDEFLDEYNIKRSSFSHRVCLRREGSSGIVALKQRSNQTPLTPDLK
jgi:hypothetical protein